MGYDRNKAISYATSHWATVCDDRIVSVIGAAAINVDAKFQQLRLPGPKSEWTVKFIPDPDPDGGDMAVWWHFPDSAFAVIQRWKGLGDCAHFMSRTLTAGGIQGLRTDYVPYLNGFLRNPALGTKILGDEIPQDRVQGFVNAKLLKKGDVILYIAPPGGELGGGYVHSAMFTDDSGKITCHSINRFGDDWTAPHSTGYTFTLIHFSFDDPSNALLDGRLAGWWEVKWRGESYYYFFGRGQVTYTKTKPTSKVPPAFPRQKGWYFFNTPLRADQIKICWTKTGSIEELTIDGSGDSMTGTWNGVESLTATRVP